MMLDHEHQMVLEEDQARRLEAECRFRVPGCPWGCDGSGWQEIVFGEYGPLDAIPDPMALVLPHGLLLSACECNSGAGGRVRRWPGWYRS